MPDRAAAHRLSAVPATSRDRGPAPGLAVLIVENSGYDVELAVGALEDVGHRRLHWRRVEDSAGMKTALAEETWDVVISEDRMPAFDSRDALAVLRGSDAEVPLIVVCGKVAEGAAMAALHAGAADFVGNDRFDLLGSAVVRCLRHTSEERQRWGPAEADQLATIEAAGVTTVGALNEMRSSGSDSFSVEYRARGGDGELRRFEAHCGAVRGRDGALSPVWGTAQDVTERVLAGDRQRQAGEFWQGTLDSLTAHIAVLDEHGEIVAVNAAWRRFAHTEHGGADFVGSSYIAVCEATQDPVAKAVARGLGELLAGGHGVFELEYPCHSPSVQRWFLLRATRYEGAGPLRVVVAHENITERRQAQEQASMQAALLDEIDVSVIVTDLDLTVLSWSAGAERLYGWTAQEAIGRSARETVLPEHQALPKDEEGFNLGLQRDGRWEGEYTVRRKDGSTFPAHVRARALADQDGRATGAVNVAMDITDRKAAERALLSARNYSRAVTDSMGEGVLTCDPEVASRI
jgi:PAS domain S-box-containing protein